MLKISNLSVKVGEKLILNNVNLDFEVGKIYFLLGKNGSGKSSLAYAISGNPKYKIISGDIQENNKSIKNLEVNKIANESGIFLSFQNIPEIPGVKFSEYLRTIYNENQKAKNPDFKPISPFLFKRFILNYLKDLNLSESVLDRDLNVGFSGGEKRKLELLQIKLLDPKYIVLDEIDSGLDIDAFKMVASELQKIKNSKNTLIFITHNFGLLEYVNPDKVYVMENGKVIDSGNIELAKKIQKHGYCSYCNIEETCNLENKCQ